MVLANANESDDVRCGRNVQTRDSPKMMENLSGTRGSSQSAKADNTTIWLKDTKQTNSKKKKKKNRVKASKIDEVRKFVSDISDAILPKMLKAQIYSDNNVCPSR